MTSKTVQFADLDPEIVRAIVKLTQSKLPPNGASREEIVKACVSILNTILYAAARFAIGAQQNLAITITQEHLADAAAAAYALAMADSEPGVRS